MTASIHSKSQIFDSFDPKYPDLPTDLFYTNESDVFSDSSEEEGEALSRVSTTIKTSEVNKSKRNRRYTESAYSSTAARERIKWEPGIDIDTTEVILSSLGSSITITDYNEKRYRVERVDIKTEHSSLESRLTDDENSSEECSKLELSLKSRPKWSKVRWVNVNGLSWESITVLGKFYNLHRLAIEDMVDIPTRTKVEFFPGCLFGVMPLIKLVKEHETSNEDEETEMTINEILSEYYEMRRLNETFKFEKQAKNYQHRQAKFLNNQKPLSYRSLYVGIEQSTFFILPNGILLTFFESSGDDIENAILTRISKEQALLRTSCDTSILLHNILDVIVDIILPILTAYKKRLNEFEVDVLINPNLKHTQSLHVMSGELANLRRALLPITSLISTLRELSKTEENEKIVKRKNQFITAKSEIYFADIVDHTMMYTFEIEGMINTIDNLIGLTFNTISTSSNTSMKQLSLVTVIFLPLSFWTGYYGMNFTHFGDLDHSVTHYWKVAAPFCIVLVFLLTWDLIRDFALKCERIFLDLKHDSSNKISTKKPVKRHRRRSVNTVQFVNSSNIV